MDQLFGLRKASTLDLKNMGKLDWHFLRKFNNFTTGDITMQVSWTYLMTIRISINCVRWPPHSLFTELNVSYKELRRNDYDFVSGQEVRRILNV